ncbi:hypothetical protein [Streptomyces hawaiiensis]|uniref:Uncharacterized protein n=1 Tax=Streptomyces hawaiiensis TaxID=67305 RepID=A0A6G5RG94_9ACTN|nr:hypothetical protein [Streptomyces hawaiiensis]QCD57153.1 hypothetical protein CEB94_21610 [Streptomyces hawaiiensis]
MRTTGLLLLVVFLLGRRLAVARWAVFALGLLPHLVHPTRVRGPLLGLIPRAGFQANRAYVGDGLAQQEQRSAAAVAGLAGRTTVGTARVMVQEAMPGRRWASPWPRPRSSSGTARG